MKREIKFRAWHIPTKRMFDIFSWCKDCVFEYSEDGVGTSPTLPAEMKDCELMQFTGLYDIHGKEIYEGDIVMISYNHLGKIIVYFEYGKFNISKYDVKKCSIIGNIHEHPELLC